MNTTNQKYKHSLVKVQLQGNQNSVTSLQKYVLLMFIICYENVISECLKHSKKVSWLCGH